MMVGAEARKAMQREHLKNRIKADMSECYRSCTGDQKTYSKVREEEEKLLEAKYPGKKQTCYDDIPVFPYGYTEENLPSWGESYKDLTNSYLPSIPTMKHLNNLYKQLEHHSTEMASLLLPATGPDRFLNQVPVTPPSPAPIFRPPVEQKTQGCDKMVVDDSPQSRKNAEEAKERAKKEAAKKEAAAKWYKKIAPPDTRTAPRARKEKDEEEEKPRPAQDIYEIVRVRSCIDSSFLELLRQISDGYIIGWRILMSLEEFLTAHWCIFNDFAYLERDLAFLKMRILRYDSGYRSLSHIYYGEGTLDVIMGFLKEIYGNPELHYPEELGRTFFYILCLLFGECPRLELPRDHIFKTMGHSHWDCADLHNTHLKLGKKLNDLFLKWSNTSDTTLYLFLVQLEKIIEEKIFVDLGQAAYCSFGSTLEQFEFNREKAHDRCDTLMVTFSSMFDLTQEQDSSGKYHQFDVTALYQLLNEQLHLVKHNPELVKSILLRRGGFRKPIIIPGVKSGLVKPIPSADVMFWRRFVVFTESSMVSALDVMNFLEHSRPFLIGYQFEENHKDICDDLVAKCDYFTDARAHLMVSPDEAAYNALLRGLKYLSEEQHGLKLDWRTLPTVPDVVEFLIRHKPVEAKAERL